MLELSSYHSFCFQEQQQMITSCLAFHHFHSQQSCLQIQGHALVQGVFVIARLGKSLDSQVESYHLDDCFWIKVSLNWIKVFIQDLVLLSGEKHLQACSFITIKSGFKSKSTVSDQLLLEKQNFKIRMLFEDFKGWTLQNLLWLLLLFKAQILS